MDNNRDIEKIEEQINSLKNRKNTIKKVEDNHEVFIDKKYSLGDKIPDEVIEEELEKTKVIEDINKIDNEDIETTSLSNESIVENKIAEDNTEEKIIEEKNGEEIDNNTDNSLDTDYKSKKKLILIIILLAVIVIFICVLFVLTKKEKTANYVIEEEKIDKKLTSQEKRFIINDYGSKLEELIRVYYNKNNKLLSYDDASKMIDYEYKIYCYDHEVYTDGKIYLNDCSINEEKTTYSYGEKIVIPEKEENGDFHVYVNKTTFNATLDKPDILNDYNDYSLKIDNVYGKVYLLNEYDPSYVFYLDSEKNGHMINFKNGKKALSSISYQSILPIKNGDGFEYDYVAIQVNNKWGIYKLSNNERVVSHIYDNVLVKYVGTDSNDNYIDSLSEGLIVVSNNDLIGVLSYYSGSEIIPVSYKSLVKVGSYLMGVDSNSNNHIFDYNGVEYLKDKYDKIYGIVSDKYILVKTKKNVLLVGLNGEIYYDYLDIKSDNYNYGIEYNDGVLFQFFGEDSKCINLYYDSVQKTGEIKDSVCN